MTEPSFIPPGDYRQRTCYSCNRTHWHKLNRCAVCSDKLDTQVMSCFVVIVAAVLLLIAYFASFAVGR